ncbi:MAG: hypothetical protein IKT52_07780 [Oscillospiraceae bacterium]|nr:hypothetical protein [Oscillospiraceae bacterium]
MFGKRADGKLLKKIDPIIMLTAYLMPMRCDAQVMMDFKVDFEVLTRYIARKRDEGYQITFQELLIAAFVRTIAEIPEANRFIINKRIYSRNELTVAFTLLMDGSEGVNVEENAVKCKFEPTDTIFDVAARVSEAIRQNRTQEESGFTLTLARFLARPFLAAPLVGLIRLLDRYGLLPKVILDASPFHTSLFVTNMASIGMPAVKHHIYNFGTTSMFFSIGMPERTVAIGPEGKAVRKRMLPMGVVADERICAGAVYARVVSGIMKCLNNPELMETPAQNVRYEEGNEYHLPVPKEKKKKQSGQKALAE